MNTGDWLSFIEHQFVNGACPLFTMSPVHRIEHQFVNGACPLFMRERSLSPVHANIAIERCFRHIAIGRRNWLHTGSHQAAKNIAFMFGLLETCKLNDIDFGIYIEDVLTRIMYGEHVDDTFLPCGYVPRYKEGQDAA